MDNAFCSQLCEEGDPQNPLAFLSTLFLRAFEATALFALGIVVSS